VLLQQGDPRTLAHWQTLVDASRRYFSVVYEKFGALLVDEDIRGESFYNPFLPEVAAELERKGIARVDNGALCVFLPKFVGREGDPVPLIVRKSDGGYGYATTDLAAIRYRTQTLRADRVLYVVGAPQQQHFAMVFETAKLAGWLDGANAEHVSFGSVLGTDRKMLRTRSGDSVRLVDLLDEATLRAQSAVREKNPDMPEELRGQIAQSVGIGAIKYADLSTERIKDYVFDWSRMLSFEGNTGPYLQYAHARICSILRKAGDDGVRLAKELDMDRLPEDGRISLAHPAERALGLELMEFGVAVRNAGTGLQPHRLCAYLYELATKFTAFFEACPVLKAETPELRESRLLLCGATRRTLALGLELLGIRAPERM
jgi:arginyl-tRNA synthetase